MTICWGHLIVSKPSRIYCPHSFVTQDRQALLALGREKRVEGGREQVKENQ